MRTKQFHILKVINLFLLIVIISSCSSSNPSVRIGKYASNVKPPNTLTYYYNKYILNIKSYTMGDTLTIYDTQYFTYHSCGGNKYGKYRVNEDTLFLDVDSAIAHRDKKVYRESFTDMLLIKSDKLIEERFKSKLTSESKESFNSLTLLLYIGESK